MAFEEVFLSGTFITEFDKFINFLIQQKNIQYVDGGIFTIEQIINSNTRYFYDFSDNLIDLIKENALGGMLGSKRKVKTDGEEYILSFLYGSFVFIIVGYVESSHPKFINLVDFQYKGK